MTEKDKENRLPDRHAHFTPHLCMINHFDIRPIDLTDDVLNAEKWRENPANLVGFSRQILSVPFLIW